MRKIPRGKSPHIRAGVAGLLCCVIHGKIPEKGASVPAQARCQTRAFKRILLVDDELLILQCNTAVLTRSGYHAEIAQDGAAAWEALQAKAYDLLITDNNMPRLSGIELVKKVRSAHLKLPVILASGNLPTGELGRNPLLQPIATLAKPFTGEELLRAVSRALCESITTSEQIEPLPIFSQGTLGHRAPVASTQGFL